MIGLKSSHNRNGVEILIVKCGVIFQLSVNLMDSQWNDGFVIDWFVFLFVRVHSESAVVSRPELLL